LHAFLTGAAILRARSARVKTTSDRWLISRDREITWRRRLATNSTLFMILISVRVTIRIYVHLLNALKRSGALLARRDGREIR